MAFAISIELIVGLAKEEREKFGLFMIHHGDTSPWIHTILNICKDCIT